MRQALDIRTKHRIRRFVYGKLALFVLLTLLVFSVHAGWSMYEKGKEANARRIAAEEELARLHDRESELTAEITRLKSPRGVEEELRERYMVVKEGEHVMVINDTTTQKEDLFPLPAPSWWQRLLGAVGVK